MNFKLLRKYEKFKNIVIVINPNYIINHSQQRKVLVIINDSFRDNHFKVQTKHYKNKIVTYKDRASVEKKLINIKNNYLIKYKKIIKSINLIGCPLLIKMLKNIIKKQYV